MSGRGENLLFDTFTGSLKKSIPRMTHEWIGCLKQLSSMFYRFERLLHKIILQIGLNMNWKTEKNHWLITKKQFSNSDTEKPWRILHSTLTLSSKNITIHFNSDSISVVKIPFWFIDLK